MCHCSKCLTNIIKQILVTIIVLSKIIISALPVAFYRTFIETLYICVCVCI